jgi:hypothetical protein
MCGPVWRQTESPVQHAAIAGKPRREPELDDVRGDGSKVVVHVVGVPARRTRVVASGSVCACVVGTAHGCRTSCTASRRHACCA